jgi:DNA-binding NtrC family response regulator
VMIDKVAQTDARVLITGPNGTEVSGASVAWKSERANYPLMKSIVLRFLLNW